MQPTRERVSTPVLPACAGLGLVAGALAKAADESGWGWAADLGSFPAVWVLAVALLGRAAPTVRAAVARSAVFFAAMSVAYYAWAALVLGFGWNRLLVAWLLLSVTAVPAVAAAVQWATRRPGPLPGALLAGAAGIVLAGGAVLADARAHPVQAVADVVVAAVLVTVLPRHGRTRLWRRPCSCPRPGRPAGAWPSWPRCSADGPGQSPSGKRRPEASSWASRRSASRTGSSSTVLTTTKRTASATEPVGTSATSCSPIRPAASA